MPPNPEWLPREQILRQEEFIALSKLFVEELGISHIRLTGGEPLLRKDVVEITAGLNQLRAGGLQKLSMTSNGVLLPKYAQPLADAGLDDINISLDSVDPALFEKLTHGGKLSDV
ncbi:MAG: cyclic pyranopterin phosphate synthase, partial [Gammaproteobacteria bacterium]